MGKGILLEMGGREAVVLTPQGEFKKVPAPKGTWEIGDEIQFADTRQQSYWAKWGLAAAAAAILVLAPVGWAGYQQVLLGRPEAIVTLDINPSLELTLNKVDDVLSARGLNADGTALLQQINTKGRPPLDQVVQAATQAAADMNKLDPTDPASAVLLAVAPTGDTQLPVAKAESIREKAKQAVATEVSQLAKQKGAEPKTTVAGVVVTPAEKKAAEAAGLSPGKYILYEDVKQVVPDVKVEDVQNAGPGKLLKNLNINPGDFFGKSEEKHGADDQNKAKSEENSQQQATPVTGKPEDKQSGNGKTENPGKGNDKQEPKQDDKGNAPAEPKKDEKQQDQKQHGNGTGNGTGNGVQQENKSNARDEKKGESGTKGEPKKQESPGQKENGNDKKSSWTIPFLGITIEKPAFLQGKDDTKTEPSAPVVATPQADQPGAGAPADKQSDQKQSDQKQSDQKQSDQKQSDQKQSDQKQSDQKQSDQKQSDKGSSKEQDKNNGKDQSNKDSGKSNGKDKGD